MASYPTGSFGFRTLNLYETKDPLKNLWRNVLIVGIEDLLKKKEIHIKFNTEKKYSLEEMWFDHEDFDLICEYSELAPKIVRKRVFEAIERIENKYANKRNMSEMPGQWFYKSEGINREPNRHSTTMYDV